MVDEAPRHVKGEREEDEDDPTPTDPDTGEIDWVKAEAWSRRKRVAELRAARGAASAIAL
jgi:hypothetical protein